jgi:hypothetical protein
MGVGDHEPDARVGVQRASALEAVGGLHDA